MSAVPEGFSGVQIRSVVEDGGVDSYAPAPHNVNGVHNRSANAVGGLFSYVPIGHVEDHGEQETEAALFCAWYVAFGQMEHDSLGAVKEYPLGQKSQVSSQPIVVLP